MILILITVTFESSEHPETMAKIGCDNSYSVKNEANYVTEQKYSNQDQYHESDFCIGVKQKRSWQSKPVNVNVKLILKFYVEDPWKDVGTSND